MRISDLPILSAKLLKMSPKIGKGLTIVDEAQHEKIKVLYLHLFP